MIITTKLSIDMQNNVPRPVISAVQNDSNSRAIEFLFYSGCTPWTIPDGITAALSYSKPDGTAGIYDKLPDGAEAFSISGTAISAIMAPQMLTVPGEVKAAIVLSDANSTQLSTFPFIVNVVASPNPGKIVSENYCYYTNLDAINEAINALQQAGGGSSYPTTTEITEESTDKQVPTAKAVYDYVTQNSSGSDSGGITELKSDFVANCKHINIFDYRNAGIFKGYIDADSHLVEDVTSLHIAYIHVTEGEIYTINRLSDSYKRFLIYSCAGDPMPNMSVTLLKGAGFENHNGRDYGRAIIPNGHNRLLIAYYHKTYDTVDSDTLLRDIVVYEGREIIDGFIPYNTLNVEKYNLLPEYQNMPIDVAELKSDLAELKRKTKVIVPESIIQEDWAPMCYAVEGKYLYAGCNTMSIYKYDMSCSWNPERVAALNPAVLISQFEPSSKFGQYRGAAFGIAVCHDLVYVAWRVMSGGLTDYDTETYLGFMSVLSCNDLSIVKIIKLPYKCTGLSIYGNYLVLSHHFDGFSVWDIGGDNASNPNKIAEWSVASRDTEIEWQNCGIEENYDGNLIITFAKYYDGIQSYLFNTTTKTITEFDALHLADIAELCDGNEKVHSVYNVVVDNGMVYGALSTGFSQKHNTELDHRGIIYGTIGNLMSTYKIVKISDSDRPPLLSSGDPAPSRIVKVGDTIITNLDSCGFAIFCKNGSEYEYIGKSSAPLTDPELSTSGGMYADNTGKIIATQNKYTSSAQKNQVIATYKIAEIVN